MYKCPADPSMVLGQYYGPRARSYAASQAVGTCWQNTGSANNCPSSPANGGVAGGPVTGAWLGGSDEDCQDYGFTYGKASQMIRPSPANLWVFAEEHPDAINDSGLAMQIANTGVGGEWIDIPSNLHDGAGSFSFADGHAEIHKWLGNVMENAKFVQNGSREDVRVGKLHRPSVRLT